MFNKKKLKLGFPLSRGGGGPTIFMKRLREAVKKNQIADVSYFFDPLTDILICSNAIRNPWNKPYVLRLDGITFDSALSQSEIKKRNTNIFKGIDNAAGLVFQAEFSRKLISSFHNIKNKEYTIIPNGVDINYFNPVGNNMRAKLGIAAHDTVFITSAKWRAHKRLDAIVNNFHRYCSVAKDKAHLIILGEIKEEKRILSNEKIYYIGHIDATELPAWYRTADICLFFSWLDNCPNTVVESIASGLPVLCTNQGGTREIIELTEGGIVVEADDEFLFKQVDLYHPPEPNEEKILCGMLEIVSKKRQLAKNIKRERLSIETVANQYVKFMQKIYDKRA